MDRSALGIRGPLFDTPVCGELRHRPDALVLVGDEGLITAVLEPADPAFDRELDRLRSAGSLAELRPGQFLLPGLIDLHNHAPQWPQLGKALDVPLAEWLSTYTFPLEARYTDLEFAARVYESLVDSMLANGTTTAAYFATRHLEATKLLADICIERGQRAFVGRVAMDHPESCPDFYRDESAAAGVGETVELIDHIEQSSSNPTGLVQAVVTPRFLPSCTDALLDGLGEIVQDTGCYVQTHCSESDWAHQYGLTRFGQTDTRSYFDLGLLTRKTILAHSNFVDSSDLQLIAEVGASVAHCPLSNVFFANAVFPVREALDKGVHVGLGTDVSGGASPSMLNAVANAVAVSRVREDGVDATTPAAERGSPGARINFAEAFWMATAGGGIALDLPIGVLAPGYSFDAVVIDSKVSDTDLQVWDGLDSAPDTFQKMILNTVRRNVAAVWVKGRQVRSTAFGPRALR